MITLKSEIIKDKLIRRYAEDEQGVRYYIRQVETGVEYDEAVDILPCRYTYVVTEKVVQDDE
jgi:hypothetical protein